MMRPLVGAALTLMMLAPRPADAHAIGLSRGQYRALPEALEARLVFDRAELGALLEGARADAPEAAGDLSSARARAIIEQRIVQRVHVLDRRGKPCPGVLRQVLPSDGAAVTLAAHYGCEDPLDPASVAIEFWDALTPGHRHLASAASGVSSASGVPGATSRVAGSHVNDAAGGEQILYERQPRLALEPVPLAVIDAPSFLEWIGLGIEHILTGYDHLLFLLGLVLVMPVLRTLAATASIFTVAHSITLGLATFRVAVPPASWIEAAIALTITYVGFENLTPRAARPRFLLVFGFGLIHGFGFAGALAELGVPEARAPAALFAFNVGVELGQLGVLALLFPSCQLCRRSAWFGPRGVPAISLALAVLGVVWFFERV